jgi:hypothetical protein
MKTAGAGRLPPCLRGEDEGEGFGGTHGGPALTLPLSLQKVEAIQCTRGHSKASSQT